MHATAESSPAIRRRETQVVLSGAGERYRRLWLPTSPERAMILVHGYAEHTGRYDEMAMHFARRGFAVHAYDQAGHGRTRGPRGHVDRFERLIEELGEFVALVGREHPGLPITLVGHSMGGLVTAATASFLRPPVDRIVLSGALLRLDDTGPRQRLALGFARLLSLLAPRLGLSAGLDVQGLSRDPEVVRRYLEDPFVEDRMSARFAAGLSRMAARVAAAAEQVDRPVLLLHGAADPICPPIASQAFHAGLAPEVAARSRLRLYPDLRHEIFQEPERERVWQDLLDWLDGVPATADATTGDR